ncbi:MAG: hypothetical protein ACYTEG_11200 [Planctomycetota bacterium]|jgi:hypothetical protein
MRLLAAVLVVAALLWWLLQEDDTSRRERAETAAEAERRVARIDAGPAPAVEKAEEQSVAPLAKPIGSARIIRGRVQVRGRDDAPLAGISFRSEPDLLRFTGPTDDLGWTDWTLDRPLPPNLVIVDSFLRRKHAVTLPVTTIRFPNLIPLEAEFIDAATGAVLEEGSISLSTDHGKTVHGRTPRMILHAPIVPGQICNFLLHLDPPKGATGELGLHEFVRCFVSQRAHAAHLRIPVWPEMRLMLEFRDAHGNLASGVQVESAGIALRPVRVHAKPSDHAGRTVLEGVPFVRRARLQIRAGGRIYETRIWRRDQFSRLRVGRASSGDVFDSEITVVNETASSDELQTIGTGVLSVEARWGDRERADVRVALQWGTNIETARTESGVAAFRNLPAGQGRVAVLDPALAYEERPVSLRDGGKIAVTIGPAQGRSMSFVVNSGRPVAGARLTVTGWHGEIAPPIVNGVQELAAVTVAGGLFVWHGFPLQEAKVFASRGLEGGEERVRRGIRGDRAPIRIRRLKR